VCVYAANLTSLGAYRHGGLWLGAIVKLIEQPNSRYVMPAFTLALAKGKSQNSRADP